MSDIKCPMCGKPNSADAEICAHCQARIKPSFGSSSEDSAGEGSADWLSALSGDLDLPEEETSQTAASDEGANLFAKMRKQNDSAEAGAADELDIGQSQPVEASSSTEEDLPDWMQGLMGGEEDSTPPQSTAHSDWLSQLDADDAKEKPQDDLTFSFDDDPESSKAEAGSDWLNKLGEAETPEESSQSDTKLTFDEEQAVQSVSFEEKAEGDVSWENDLQGWQAPVDEEKGEDPGELFGNITLPAQEEGSSETIELGETAQEADTPDWLAGISKEDVSFPSEETLVSSSETSDVTSGTAQDEDESQDDLEIWLRSLDVDPKSLEPESLKEQSTSEPELEFDLPDLDGEAAPEELTAVLNGEADKVSFRDEDVKLELPDDMPWMKSDTTQDEDAETAEQQAEDVPVWLGSQPQQEESAPLEETQVPTWLENAKDAFEKEEGAEDIPVAAEDIPEWLGAAESQPESEDTAQTQIPPDWLKDQVDAPLPEPKLTLDAVPVQEEKDVLPFDLGEEELPNWLSETSGSAEPTVFEDQAEKDDDAEAETAIGIPPFIGDDLGDWLTDLEEVPTPETEEESGSLLQKVEASSDTSPFGDDEFTNMLSEAGIDPAQVAGKTEGQERTGDGLQESELPGWVQAMRPIEAIAEDAVDPLDERKVESAGPLAGLRAILPAEDIILHYQKPPVYSMKLQVSEKQKAHAGLLERMIEPGKLKAKESAKVSGLPVRVLRLVIGVLLLAAVLLPSFFNIQQVPVIDPDFPVLDFHNRVGELSAGQTVLIAADFDTAYYGEMKLASQNLFQHLSRQEVSMALVSTLPTGAVLGEMLIDEAYARGQDFSQRYSQPDWTANLGYLAGGVASLQELASNPRGAVRYGMQAGLNDQVIWDTIPLQDIQALSDFGMIVLLTDNVETGRAWIEQIQPGLEKTPFLLITSAQAAPVLEAYYQSGQVDGMLAGYRDGMSYTMLYEAAGTIDPTWSSFYYGIMIAVCLLLLGILISVILSFVKGQKKESVQA